MVLSLAQIKSKSSSEVTKDVPVPAWGGDVRLKKLGAAPALALGRMYSACKKDDGGNLADPQEMVDFFVLLIANSIVDDGGNREFLTAEGKEFLGKEPLEVLTELANEAMEFNGMADATAVDKLEKKLPSAPTGNSPSSLPKDSTARTPTTS